MLILFPSGMAYQSSWEDSVEVIKIQFKPFQISPVVDVVKSIYVQAIRMLLSFFPVGAALIVII